MKNQLKEEKAKREFGRWSDYCLDFFFLTMKMYYYCMKRRERGRGESKRIHGWLASCNELEVGAKPAK